jgi:hypothetical protein
MHRSDLFSRAIPKRSLSRSATVLILLAPLLGLAACAGGSQYGEPAQEPSSTASGEPATTPTPIPEAKMAPGTFHATVTGTTAAELEGTAVCTQVEEEGELGVVLRSSGDTFPFLMELGFAAYRGTGEYSGSFELNGAARSGGTVQAGIDESPGEEDLFRAGLNLDFSADFDGDAGTGHVEGEVQCSLPSREEASPSPEAGS